MSHHEKINYIEFQSKNIQQTKDFFAHVFSWKYQDYGPEYVAVLEAGIECGFYKSDKSSSTENGSVLIVFYSENLEQTLIKITDANGAIVKEIFSFPGGRRFHFADPNGNEFAVWSDKEA